MEPSQVHSNIDQPVQPSFDSDLLMWALNSGDIIEELDHLLRGEFKNITADEKGREMIEWMPHGEPLLNNRGIRMIVTTVASHLTKEKIVTDLPKQDVIRMAKSIRLDIIYLLMQRHEDFEVKQANWDIIVDIVDHYVFSNLCRGSEGTTLNFMKPMIKRVETMKAEKEKGSMLGWLPFFGKREKEGMKRDE